MNKKLSENSIVPVLLLSIFLLSAVLPVHGRDPDKPGQVALKINELIQSNTVFRDVTIFQPAISSFNEQVTNTITQYTLLQADDAALQSLLQTPPEYIRFSIPVSNSLPAVNILLYKVNISGNGFTLETSDGRTFPELNNIAHYRGVIENDMNSVVSFSFSMEETMGLLSNDKGNYVLGELENTNGNEYVFYNDKDLIPDFTYECGTNTGNSAKEFQEQQKNSNPGVLSTNCVDWFYETDYDVFLGKGSLANVNSYIQGVFNQVSTLYDNDGISITLQTLFVWTSTDPYTGPSTSNYLNQFGSYRTSFTGDLANLVGYNGGGGVAYVDGLCSATQYKMGYMGISASYNTVPTYSWTVEVVTHEDGHLLGSRHTHDCVWNGNSTAIDGCGDAAGYNGSGSCATASLPASGTIMSYCHLVSGVGINFNNGFGPQPVALILNNINTATCLSACSGCAVPSQPGTISGVTSYCGTTQQTYSVSPVAGATSYTWTKPSGWSGTSTTNSITVTPTSTGGMLSVTANNACGSSTARTLSVTANTPPAQPGNISGTTSVCTSTSNTYSITAIPGATSYTWTKPGGWTGTSTTNSITLTSGSSGGTLSVAANNACGSGTARTLAINVVTAPAQPGTVNSPGGIAKVCPGNSVVYSIALVSGATSYNWTAPTGGTITGGQGSNTITVSYNSGFVADDTLMVAAVNACATGPVRYRVIKLNNPIRPGTISGLANNVCNANNVAYAVTNVNGMTYNWTFSNGSANVISGQGTNGIVANFSPNYLTGTLNVTASNACGTSIPRTLSVSAKPAQPAPISGTTTPCSGQSGVPYSTSPVPGAVSYFWTAPVGAHINDGTVTSPGNTLTTTATSVTINYGTSAGYIRVKAINSCGPGVNRSRLVSFGCRYGNENAASDFSVSAFPNPASEEINIQFESATQADQVIKLIDLTGKTYLLYEGKSLEGINNIAVDIRQLAPGIYFLEVVNGTERSVSKISVE